MLVTNAATSNDEIMVPAVEKVADAAGEGCGAAGCIGSSPSGPLEMGPEGPSGGWLVISGREYSTGLRELLHTMDKVGKPPDARTIIPRLSDGLRYSTRREARGILL
jgi:hypothetical protein